MQVRPRTSLYYEGIFRIFCGIRVNVLKFTQCFLYTNIKYHIKMFTFAIAIRCYVAPAAATAAAVHLIITTSIKNNNENLCYANLHLLLNIIRKRNKK